MSKQQWWGFTGANPWAGFAYGRQRFFEPGEIRLAILSLLNDGPKHGYQLMKEMQERSGGMYKASAGSVYPTLQQLEDEGMVVAEMQAGRRVFRLTDEGRKELASDPEGVRRIWQRAERCEDWGSALGPESMTLWPAVAILIRSSMKAATHVGADRVREILDRTRRELEEL
jgi:DNA-binding PadR family transcriptional regulator